MGEGVGIWRDKWYKFDQPRLRIIRLIEINLKYFIVFLYAFTLAHAFLSMIFIFEHSILVNIVLINYHNNNDCIFHRFLYTLNSPHSHPNSMSSVLHHLLFINSMLNLCITVLFRCILRHSLMSPMSQILSTVHFL